MLQLIKEDRPLSESDIKDLHRIILVEPYFSKTISPEGTEFQKEIRIGQYKTSSNYVQTVSGDIHYYTNPEEVAFEMNNLLEWYRIAEEENLHPIIISAIFHHKFTAIHPFDDGNGRLARILSNFILLKHQYPVIVIKNKDKVQYYSVLNIADNGIYEDLVKLFAENIGFSLEIMQKAINGENINEADDLDKEIELFTKQMQVQNIKTVDFEKDKDLLIEIYVKEFLEYLIPKLKKIGELFQEFYIYDVTNSIKIKEFTKKNFFNINNSSTIHLKFCFEEALSKKYNLDFDIKIKFKRKTVQYFIFKDVYGYSTLLGKVEDELFLKELIYFERTKLVFEEMGKSIIDYLISEIKNITESI